MYLDFFSGTLVLLWFGIPLIDNPLTIPAIGSIYLEFQWKIEWDLTNGPLSKLLELLDTQV